MAISTYYFPHLERSSVCHCQLMTHLLLPHLCVILTSRVVKGLSM